MFNFRSTSELENFQNLILKYASKRNSYKHWHLPYTSFCSIYVKAINIYRQFTLYKNICYHYTNEIDLIVPSLFVKTARPQCALWSRAANSSPARYAGGLYEFLFEAYLRIKFWKFSNSDVLLKLNIYTIHQTAFKMSTLQQCPQPHCQVSSLWSHTHIVKWALYGP
jgi:hypothetical protein